MSNLRVEIVRLCKTPEGWKRYPVIYRKNGKIKPNAVTVNGKGEQIFANGRYQVRWYEGRSTKYKDVGNDPAKALALRQELSRSLMLRRDGQRDPICTLTVPRSLMKRIAEAALQDGVSTDNWATAVLAQKIGAMGAIQRRRPHGRGDIATADRGDIKNAEDDM
jgi:hypothetical protein